MHEYFAILYILFTLSKSKNNIIDFLTTDRTWLETMVEVPSGVGDDDEHWTPTNNVSLTNILFHLHFSFAPKA